MSIAGLITLCRDDTDVCEGAIRSIAGICDEILVIDTGDGTLRKNINCDFLSVNDFTALMCDKGYPVTYTKIDWGTGGDHSLVRNRGAAMLAKFDWIMSIDSDEMLTLELAQRYRDLAFELPADVVTVASRLLTLYPDERHYSVHYSQLFSHGRFYRPGAITYRGEWHEHQDYRGKRLDLDSYYHLHFRQLFRNRCLHQHNHSVEQGWKPITEPGDTREVAELGVTWLPIIYPREDLPNAVP